MKNLITMVLAVLLVAPAYTQEDSAKADKSDVISVSEDNEIITTNSEDVIVTEGKKDTTKIKLGKKGISIIEGEKGTQLTVENLEDVDEDFDDDDDSYNGRHSKFNPHWKGFEVGINNYLNSNQSMSLDNSMIFMDLNTSRSWNVNWNFMQYGFGIVSDKIGLATGLGFEWNMYHFDNDNSIVKDVNGNIISLPLTYTDIQKNKFQTTYLRAPLLLEFQIPAGKKRIYVSAGPVGGVKLFSSTKVVYKENGNKQKVKEKDDFNLSALRYGFTARAGYRALSVFANYYMTPLFEANKGPELYPFSVGLTLLEF